MRSTNRGPRATRPRIAFLLALALAAGGCAGQPGGRGSGGSGPSDAPASGGGQDGRPTCEVLYAPPTGFLPSQSDRVPQLSAIGVRESFVDDDGREIHLTSGIEGEFGEGAPTAGELEVSTGQTGTLLGSGSDWILVWSLHPPCAKQTVGAAGFAREAFVDALRRMGVLPRAREEHDS
jgi:hypothetical protein